MSSPYTRALQTASIISKETNLDIKIEADLREWEPDTTYQYKAKEAKIFYKDYISNNGIHPTDRNVFWESRDHLKERIESVIERYKDYECVIFVFHQMAIKSVINVDEVKPTEIIEYNQE